MHANGEVGEKGGTAGKGGGSAQGRLRRPQLACAPSGLALVRAAAPTFLARQWRLVLLFSRRRRAHNRAARGYRVSYRTTPTITPVSGVIATPSFPPSFVVGARCVLCHPVRLRVRPAYYARGKGRLACASGRLGETPPLQPASDYAAAGRCPRRRRE